MAEEFYLIIILRMVTQPNFNNQSNSNHQSIFNKTIRDLLVEWNDAAPGFDAIRLGLAILILCFHSSYVCFPENSYQYYRTWSHPLRHPFLKMILPMFFFLSGFLVSKSAYRLR